MGRLGEKFGHEWEADCQTVTEIFQLIECQSIGFKNYMIKCGEENAGFSIRAGGDILEFAEELGLNINAKDIYITEVPSGASGGWKIFAAAVIIAFLWWNPYGWAAAGTVGGGASFSTAAFSSTIGQIAFAVALNLAITGINELLMPSVDKNNSRAGYFFNGPINTVKQGQAVPILYGELIIGGAPISVTYTKRPISSSGFVYLSSNTFTGDFDAISNLNPADLGVA